MTRFFVDAFYWIALLSPRDQWHARVRAFNSALAAYHLYTTDEVLTEFLAFYSATDPLLRTRAIGFVRSAASIMASATPFCFCTTQKHLTV